MATMAMGQRDARLDLRMSSDQKETIVRAAAASGMSVSQWALDRLMMSARSDLLDASTVRMSAKAFDEFLSVLEEPRAGVRGLPGRGDHMGDLAPPDVRLQMPDRWMAAPALPARTALVNHLVWVYGRKNESLNRGHARHELEVRTRRGIE